MLHVLPIVVVAMLAPQGDRAATRPVDLPEPVDPTRSAMIESVRAANLALVTAELQGPAMGRGFSVVYQGSVLIEGHDQRPGDRRRVPTTIALDCAGPGTFALRETEGGGPRASVETTLFDDGHVVRQRSAGEPFQEITGDAATAARAPASRWFPTTLLAAAIRAPASCRAGPAVSFASTTLTPVTFVDASGRACTVLLDERGRVGRVELLAAHARLGDICEWTGFDAYESREDVVIPTRVVRFDVAPAVTFEYELELASFHAGPPPPESVGLPESRRADVPSFGVRAPVGQGFDYVALAPGLWSIEIAAANARVVVIERESDLVVIDAPDGDDVSIALVRFLAAQFPAKPVRVVAFGHHHPSPSGGLRALSGFGATIVTPRALEAHVRRLIGRPVTLGLPAVTGQGAPRIETFEGETRLEADRNSVRLLDIAERSAHAFHYVVFYFPESGILFEDDLGYFPAEGKASWTPRLAGLGAALAEWKITPTRLVQGWPVRGVKREVAWTDVQEILAHPPRPPAGR